MSTPFRERTRSSWLVRKNALTRPLPGNLRIAARLLQDSVTALVAANADAFRSGYQAAYAGYQDLSKRYVGELKRPRIRFGTAIGLLGAAGAGLVVGRASHD